MANEITYRITGDPTSFKSAMAQVEAATVATTGKVNNAARSVESLGTKLSGVGSAMTLGITAPAAALGAAVVKTAADMEALKAGLGAVTKEGGALENQLARLKEVAKLPGLGLKEAIQGSTSLQAAGFSAQLAERSLKAFGNALATVGKGKAELDGVTLALSQIASKGKISAEEINQLAERVPQIRVAMKDAFGTADTEVLQKAGIGAEEFVTKVVAQLEKLKQVTGGTKNSFENLSDAVTQAAERVGQKLLPSVNAVIPKIEALVTAAADGVDAFARMSPEAQNLALTLGGVAIAAGPVISVIGKVSAGIASMQTIAGAAGAAMAGLFAVTIVAAIAQTMSSIDKLNEKYKALKEFQDRLRTGQQDLIKGFEDNGKPLGSGASIASGGAFDQPASAARKYSIDLKAISAELGILTGEAKKAEPPITALAGAHDKAAASVETHVKAMDSIKLPTMEMLALHKLSADARSADTESVSKLADIMHRYGVVTEAAAMKAAKSLDLLFGAYRQLSDAPDLGNLNRIDFSKLPKAPDAGLPGPGGFEDYVRGGRNIGPEGMQTKEQFEAQKQRFKELGKVGKAAYQQISTVATDLSRGITDVIFQGGKLGDMLQNVAKQAAQSITRLLIEGALKKLTDKLFDVGGLMGKVFGGASGAGGTIFSAAGSAGGAAGSAAGGIGGAASAASSGLAGIIGAAGSVVSAISGVIGNFQMAGMNKTLDLIEKEVRYSQIHLLNTLNKANEYWPYMKAVWESLVRMETAGGLGGAGGGTVNVSMAGAYLMSDSQMGDFADRLARFLKARGV